MSPSETRPTYLTRRLRFSAAHRYHHPELSDEENRRIFGACNNRYGHGHNYELEVTVVGPVDPVTGMVMNLVDLDQLLQREIVTRFDHRHINHEVEGFDTCVPTTENLAARMWKLLELELPEHCRLHRIRLYEDPDLYVDCYGDRS
ncbi:MAG: 6-carboxytetrahydropterin synthase [Planctomycetota bacterium]